VNVFRSSSVGFPGLLAALSPSAGTTLTEPWSGRIGADKSEIKAEVTGKVLERWRTESVNESINSYLLFHSIKKSQTIVCASRRPTLTCVSLIILVSVPRVDKLVPRSFFLCTIPGSPSTTLFSNPLSLQNHCFLLTFLGEELDVLPPDFDSLIYFYNKLYRSSWRLANSCSCSLYSTHFCRHSFGIFQILKLPSRLAPNRMFFS